MEDPLEENGVTEGVEEEEQAVEVALPCVRGGGSGGFYEVYHQTAVWCGCLWWFGGLVVCGLVVCSVVVVFGVVVCGVVVCSVVVIFGVVVCGLVWCGGLWCGVVVCGVVWWFGVCWFVVWCSVVVCGVVVCCGYLEIVVLIIFAGEKVAVVVRGVE